MNSVQMHRLRGLPSLTTAASWLRDSVPWRWFRSRSSGGSASAFGGAQVALRVILRYFEDDDLIRRSRASDVKLHWFTDGLILFLDRLVVSDHVHRVLEALGVHFVQLHLNGTNALNPLLLIDIEFEDVAFVEALELLHFVMISRDQSALHTRSPIVL